MLHIFAKKGTDEKAFVPCPNEFIGEVMNILKTKYGGEWLFVDQLNAQGDILKFNDGLIYNGFTGTDERYSKAIENIGEVRAKLRAIPSQN